MKSDAVVKAAAGEVEVVRDGDRCLAGVHGGMDVTLGGMEGNPDVLHWFGGGGGSGNTGGHAEGGGQGCR